MENLKNILREILKYKEELKMPNISDDMILRCATAIFNSQNIDNSKDKRFGNMQKSYPKKQNYVNNSDVPATAGQLYYLNKHKISIPEGITKAEAHKIISSHKGDKNAS